MTVAVGNSVRSCLATSWAVVRSKFADFEATIFIPDCDAITPSNPFLRPTAEEEPGAPSISRIVALPWVALMNQFARACDCSTESVPTWPNTSTPGTAWVGSQQRLSVSTGLQAFRASVTAH